jgi:lysozyme
MQPVTSAGISGLGTTPLGPVEGTWVVIMFRDEAEQQPIILGVIGGIPQAQGGIDQDNNELVIKGDGMDAAPSQQTTTTPNGGIISNNSSTPATQATGLNPASSYNASADAIALIKQFEGLKLKSYQDSVGIWTIGYGTTSIMGSPVGPGMTITEDQANQYLLTHFSTSVYPILKSATKSPITQSMFDALCSFIYNLGSGTYKKSTLLTTLNIPDYMGAANQFSSYNKAGGKILEGLTRRRSAETQLFLKDGVPSVTGDLAPVNNPSVAPVDSSPTASGLNPSTGSSTALGFKDPTGKYPLYLNEPDTNKLARGEDIKKTIVYTKEQTRDTGVKSVGITWDQSQVPYNATYPFNHVMMTESGHVMEFDDTKGSERIHVYHKSGTFTEIDANGTQVNRIVGDGYEILERNGYVHIKGALNVTVEGDVNLQVNNNMNVAVAGAFKLKAASINLESTGATNLYSENSLNLESAAATNILAGATLNMDATRLDLGDGRAGSATKTGITLPEAEGEKEFPNLVVVHRGLQAAAVYETPDEGDPAAYQAQQISDGTLIASEVGSGTAQGSTAVTPNNVAPLPQSCNIISSMTNFTPELQLSSHFKLAAFTQNGTRMPCDQVGLTAQQIVCNLKGLAENCLEKIIGLYPNLQITSGFRRPGDVANSSPTSQHYNGQAADIVIPGFDRTKHYDAIQSIQQIIPYDQLILEYSGASTVWIHVSFSYTNNRKMSFTMRDHQRYGDMGHYTLIT